MNQLPTDLLPSRHVKIQMLLLIAACLLIGCSKSAEDGAAMTVQAVTNSIGMRFNLLPGGTFAMGSELRVSNPSGEGPGQFVAVGSTPIEDLEERLNVTFSAPEADTLSGLIMHYAQEIVEEGQSVRMGSVQADVLDASNGRAVRVRLTLPEESIGSPKSRRDS